ncbi:MAG: hypothetical protein AAF919_16125 [Pseudomonadota bacterium]
MSDVTRTAIIVAGVVFIVMAAVPIASFLLRAAVVAAVAGGAVWLAATVFGGRR